jgi:hypothetical protein
MWRVDLTIWRKNGGRGEEREVGLSISFGSGVNEDMTGWGQKAALIYVS